VKIGGSSPNNANSPSGEKEKDWVLDIAKRTRAALLKQALDQGKNISVFLTREADVNVGLSARANVAKAKKAGLFLSIHFNGFDNKVRGVETLFDETNNVNADEDKKFAAAIQKEALAAMHEIDPDTKTMAKYDRKVKAQSLGVLEDIHLGNTLSSHPCRACLVELEFMDTKAVEKQLSLTKSPTQAAKNRDRIAAGLAKALLSQV
jgi:N-acetylmuramoyl-L-alanine amidase